jgi:hypothetical protein
MDASSVSQEAAGFQPVRSVTKLKQRVANGVCPCCHRSFVNLHRHMAGQHPDYTKEQSE